MNQRGYYSRKVRAGKRTYFFDVRATRNGDFFMTITESKKKHKDSGFDNHKVFIYKEDFHKFIHALKEGLEHIHTELNELDVIFNRFREKKDVLRNVAYSLTPSM